MVIEGHAGVIEKCGIERIASEDEREIFGVFVGDGLSCCELVEFLDQECLILLPGHVVAFFGEEARHSGLAEGFIESERRYAVFLEAR